MNFTRKTKLADLAAMRQNRVWQSQQLPTDQVDAKLSQLQAFIGHLSETPSGRAEIHGRKKRFGECLPITGETQGQFYGRLRHWLDRSIEQSRAIS